VIAPAHRRSLPLHPGVGQDFPWFFVEHCGTMIQDIKVLIYTYHVMRWLNQDIHILIYTCHDYPACPIDPINKLENTSDRAKQSLMPADNFRISGYPADEQLSAQKIGKSWKKCDKSTKNEPIKDFMTVFNTMNNLFIVINQQVTSEKWTIWKKLSTGWIFYTLKDCLNCLKNRQNSPKCDKCPFARINPLFVNNDQNNIIFSNY